MLWIGRFRERESVDITKQSSSSQSVSESDSSCVCVCLLFPQVLSSVNRSSFQAFQPDQSKESNQYMFV